MKKLETHEILEFEYMQSLSMKFVQIQNQTIEIKVNENDEHSILFQ